MFSLLGCPYLPWQMPHFVPVDYVHLGCELCFLKEGMSVVLCHALLSPGGCHWPYFTYNIYNDKVSQKMLLTTGVDIFMRLTEYRHEKLTNNVLECIFILNIAFIFVFNLNIGEISLRYIRIGS